MSRPVGVCISDIHFNLNTIEVASKALNLAVDKANELNVNLFITGDMHDTKANVRGECIIAIQKCLARVRNMAYVLRGNHDSLNEKSDQHSLHFLPMCCHVVSEPEKYDAGLLGNWVGKIANCYMIPYYHDVEALRLHLKTLPAGATLFMHQGIQGSNSGEYFQDKSAITPEDVASFRVISGHYHNRQTIELPDGGRWDYVGNPFSLNFAEANDPPKGFQVLYDDGSLEFIPTNLRKHVVIDIAYDMFDSWMGEMINNNIQVSDILWIKISGPKEHISNMSKKQISETLMLKQDFKLELIPTEQTPDKTIEPVSQTKEQVLDGLIDSLSNTTVVQKQRLKSMWRDFV